MMKICCFRVFWKYYGGIWGNNFRIVEWIFFEVKVGRILEVEVVGLSRKFFLRSVYFFIFG